MSSKPNQASSSKKKDAAGHWKSAVDMKSGRVYYYNSKTRETTWNKPFELATPEEQSDMIRKKEEASRFFQDMERNIISKFMEPSVSMMDSTAPPTYNQHHFDGYYSMDDAKWDNMTAAGDVMFAGNGEQMDYFGGSEPFKEKPVGRPRLLSSSSMTAPRMIRTISTIDDDLLEILKFDERMKSAGVSKNGTLSRGISREEEKSPLVGYDKRRLSNSSQNWFTNSPLASSSMDSSSSSFVYRPNNTSVNNPAANNNSSNFIMDIPKAKLKRRNSTGTIYIGTTMSVQDNEATIKCVCVVIRAHIIEAAKRNAVASREYDVFKDPPSTSHPSGQSPPPIPSLAEIKEFFMLIFSKSQLESECIIMALIYCERMIKETQGRFIIRHDNWKSILFACLVMASKVWDDLSMWNVDFSQISLSFNLQRVNALELAVLETLDYVIRVPASEYAKYYFHLRSMMARLGFHDNEPNKIAPLDIKGARKLQLATERYQEDRQTVRQVQSMRLDSGSLSSLLASGKLERHVSADGFEMESRLAHQTVGLEQIVHMEHNDADGIAHTSNKNTPKSMTSPTQPRVGFTNVVGFA